MKLRRVFFTFLILLAAFRFCLSQEKNENLILVASTPKITYEEISARTDYFASEVYETPNAVGFIVFHGGSNPIGNAFYKYALISNLRFRNYDKEKLKVITSTSSQEMKIDFWLSRDGTPPIVEPNNDSLILPPSDKALFFAGDLIDLSEIDGKQPYYFGGCEGGCIEYPNFYLLSEILQANPKLNAFVIIHGKNFKTVKLVKSVIKQYAEDSPNRIKFIYGGKNKINQNRFSEIEVYLASDEKQLPQSPTIKYRPLQ